ncbi:MAG: cellulase family glycosylhydrolase, partial [Thermoleophilaceae bacterium]|nr:cellulase family glycosylhydrolase [Thermoleophilaceae bacterium]
ARGIYTLIDFHQDMYNEKFNGQGFPDWAVYDDGLPNQPDVGFPGNYFTMLGLQRAYDNFWNNRPGPGGFGLQTRYAAAWKHVAARMRDVPGVFGYDIMNEPFQGTSAAACVLTGLFGCTIPDSKLQSFSNRVRSSIRSVDSQRIVFYEPYLTYDFGLGTRTRMSGSSVGFSFHPYCIALMPGSAGLPAFPPEITGQTCQALEQLVFSNAEQQSRSIYGGNALLATEFGASDNLEDIERLVGLADKNLVSWQYWAWFNRDPSGDRPQEGIIIDPALPPTASNLKQAKLDVLVRPYPHAVSGTPTTIAFDRATKQFDMSYKTARPGAAANPALLTEISVPVRQYPTGYSVTVSGGTVVSAPNAAVLKVQAVTGALSVTVQVQPNP